MTSRSQTPIEDREDEGASATQDKPRRGGRAGVAAGGGGAEEGLTADERERVVKGVVRLALFSVGGGRPFTRDDVTKKVFGRLLPEAKAAQTRTLYNGVLEEARRRLQSVFGYDLVNLRDIARGGTSNARGRGAAAAAAVAATLSQESQPLTGSSQTTAARRGAAGGSGTGAAAGTSTYVLVNTMPGDLAVLDGPVCIRDNSSSDGDSAAGAATTETTTEEGGGGREEGGEEETAAAALRGLLMVVLGLVVMSGGRVGEDALLAHLHVLGVERAFGLAQRRDVEGQLARFVQQQYLARQYTRRALPVGAAAAGAGEGAGSTAEYVVGPRTLAEYSRVDVLRFVAAVLGQTLTQNMAEDVLVSQQDAASISAAFAEARAPVAAAAAAAAAQGDDDDDDDDFVAQGPPSQRPRQGH